MRRKLGYFALAVVLMLVVHALPTPAGIEHGGELLELSTTGKACLGILGFAVVLWVTEALPFAITSLFVVLLIPVFGIRDYAGVVSVGFGNPIVTFFIGVLLLSAAFSRSGLGIRLALNILLKVGTRTDRVLLGFLTVGAMLSMWITDMAVAAMLLPLGVGLLRDAKLRPGESNFGRALMISCAFGPLIGGIATPAGTGANPIAIGYLKELAGIDVSFLRWMLYGLPASILMLPLAWRILLWSFPPEIERLPFERQELEAKLAAAGPLQPAELKTLTVFAVTITLWLTTPLLQEWTSGSVAPPIQAVALLGGLALFLPGMNVMTWEEAQHDVDWGGILLIVAGISLGIMVYDTGAAQWLAVILLGRMGDVPFILQPFVVVLGVASLHLLFSSNTVTGTIIIPILIALAATLNLDVWILAGSAAFTSSLAFILVTEGPTTVIPYSSGYFSIRDMAKVGIPMTVCAAACVAVSMVMVGALTSFFG
jgi:sodium-dependent dicarboxylate transporter 2/3/5